MRNEFNVKACKAFWSAADFQAAGREAETSAEALWKVAHGRGAQSYEAFSEVAKGYERMARCHFSMACRTMQHGPAAVVTAAMEPHAGLVAKAFNARRYHYMVTLREHGLVTFQAACRNRSTARLVLVFLRNAWRAGRFSSGRCAAVPSTACFPGCPSAVGVWDYQLRRNASPVGHLRAQAVEA